MPGFGVRNSRCVRSCGFSPCAFEVYAQSVLARRPVCTFYVLTRVRLHAGMLSLVRRRPIAYDVAMGRRAEIAEVAMIRLLSCVCVSEGARSAALTEPRDNRIRTSRVASIAIMRFKTRIVVIFCRKCLKPGQILAKIGRFF